MARTKDIEIISNYYQEPDEVINRTPFFFKYKSIVFQVKQVCADDYIKYCELLQILFKWDILPHQEPDDISKVYKLLLYSDIHNRSQYWNIILNYFGKLIKTHWKSRLKLTIDNIKNNLFNPKKWFVTIKGFLGTLDIFDLIELIVGYHIYCKEFKKKLLHIIQHGIGNLFHEYSTESLTTDSSGNASNLGKVHDNIIRMLKSQPS